MLDSTIKNDKSNLVDPEIPNYLSLKLSILGQSFSGKRTLSKMLNEKFDSKLKVFAMDEMIKEVLDYINPKDKTEAVDPKAKKGKGATKEEV